MIITFTNVIGAIRNAISSVITTNLKMWLGFETSETIGKNIYDGGIVSPANGGTFTDNGNGTFTVTGDGSPNLGIGVRDIDADYLTVGGTYKFSAQGANTTLAVYNSSFSLLKSGINSVEFQATTTSIKLYISPTNGVSATYSDVEVKELTQITPDKSGNNNVGELFTGKALEFDGSGDNVGIDFTTPIKSAVFWVKPLGTGIENILTFGGAFGGTKAIRSNNNVISTLGLSSVSIYVNGVQSSSVPLNQWSRVVVNFDLLTPTELRFGFAFNSYGHIQLSDVQLYDENLSADDIAYDYANPNKLAIDNPSTNLVVTNLKGYWALSEGDGLVAYDSGTNLEEEDVVNGDFATDSDWSKGTGWDIDVVNNKATCDGTQTTNSNLSQVVYTPGKVYKTIITVDSVDAGSLGIFTGTSNSQLTITEADTYTIIIEASTSDTIYIQANEFFDGSISNVSVREVTASDHGGLLNGATYVDAQPRIPQLGMMNWSKGSNLYPFSEDFENSDWIKNAGTTITNNYATSPNGDLTAARYLGTGQSGLYDIFTLSANSYTLSFYVKSNTSQTQLCRLVGDSNQVSSNLSVTTDWNRISYTFTASGLANKANGIYRDSNDNDLDILIWGAQLEESSSAGAYRLTDGAATLNSTVIPNPNNTSQDILGNAVRDRLNSFNLDGSGFAEVADDASINPTTEITVQCWIQFNSENDKGLVGKWKNPTYDYMLYKRTDSFSFYINTTSGTSNTISSSGWVNLAATYDGSNIKTYINGDLSTTTSHSGAIPNNTNVLEIGRFSENPSKSYSERISDVLLYDTALDADEIENNYNAGLSAHTNN